jgi:hypothetical protein
MKDPELVVDNIDYKIYWAPYGVSPQFYGVSAQFIFPEDVVSFYVSDKSNYSSSNNPSTKDFLECQNKLNIAFGLVEAVPVYFDMPDKFALGYFLENSKLFRNSGAEKISFENDIKVFEINDCQKPIFKNGENKVKIPCWDPNKAGGILENMVAAEKVFIEECGNIKYYKTVVKQNNEIGIAITKNELELWKNKSDFVWEKSDDFYYVCNKPKYLNWKLGQVRNIVCDKSPNAKITYSVLYGDYVRFIEDEELILKELLIGNIVKILSEELMIKDIIE